LRIWRELEDVWGLAYALEGFALLYHAGSPEQTVRIAAAATAARQRVGIRRLPGREKKVQAMLSACTGALGDEAYAEAWSAGCTMSLESAIEDVLPTLSD
jgi:hypothetical protein